MKTFERRLNPPQMVTERSRNLDNWVTASYEITRLIADTGNSHNVGESLILPSASIIMTAMTNTDAKEMLQSIPLSNSTVSRRTDEMTEDTEERLVSSI
ncbi:hypothetical protein M514_27330 [Trichuris suis]|uniref:Uncharacterized protein n=1 Tax=Trichuris suis TaxID=68888 RepID=A0A085MTE8_9BILA|nr:hypothetical protein M514_27330 [Trichuris suis]